jgi:hypothetical protein
MGQDGTLKRRTAMVEVDEARMDNKIGLSIQYIYDQRMREV